jgi:glycosyltransferase involved in cell wall biosynthesis
MAVKNTARYLPECLDSINQQTYPFWELIAVNDHSTDGSREILAQYAAKDPRIRVFDSPGQRLNPALQEGYRHLQGTLINRMDSDDRMPHDKLETMVRAWLAHGQGAIVAGGTEHFVDSGEVGGGFRRYEQWLNHVARNNLHYQEIYQECTIPSHCWLMHRDDFAAVGAFTDVYPEDYDLAFRIYRQKLKVIGLDKVLHYWRDHQVRISRTWEEYKDNRYFDLKLKYFFAIDRDDARPLLLWGAGRNGKDMAKLLRKREDDFIWVSDNPRKTGETIYGIKLEDTAAILRKDNPQIMVVVTSPKAKTEIRRQLLDWGKKPVADFWFFA